MHRLEIDHLACQWAHNGDSLDWKSIVVIMALIDLSHT